MRRAAKVDGNQPAIVAYLRGLGASVLHMHTLGQGAPDLAVGFRGVTYFLELKDPSMKPSARKLTPDEQRFHAEWRGGPLVVVESIEDIMTLLEANSGDA